MLAFGGNHGTEGRADIQRLAIPHTFNEGLGLREAAIAVTQAFLRIVLSCLLFAVWAVFAVSLWGATEGHVWQWVILVPLLALFLFSFFALMIAISVVAEALMAKKA